ncbi:hypothetical protein WME99_00420 [Sorangium sp. So ce136]|uniref:hypothetical protein n=1 Tax=Sorangium sp. So ce136 TaxID=3133284 RepID=UPI003F0B5C9D
MSVSGKRVYLVGAGLGATTLRAADPSKPVVGFSGAASGGGVSGMQLEGGSAGVQGILSNSGRPGDLVLDNFIAIYNHRGIYGEFSRLKLTKFEVVKSAWHGLSIVTADDLEVTDGEVHDNGGVGVYVDNHVPGSFHFIGEFGGDFLVYGNRLSGIEVHGDAAKMLIFEAHVFLNGVSGLRLFDAGGNTYVQGGFFGLTATEPGTGQAGDGIDALSSGTYPSCVTISGVTVQFNSRAGLGVLGSCVELSYSTIDSNLFAIHGDPWEGVPFSMAGSHDNVCRGGRLAREYPEPRRRPRG